jgi:hypothetical protein
MSQVVKHMPSKCEAVSLTAGTIKKIDIVVRTLGVYILLSTIWATSIRQDVSKSFLYEEKHSAYKQHTCVLLW